MANRSHDSQLEKCGHGILVAVATYNEIENLPALVNAIHTALPTADVLVVDDNSPDGTGQWCDEFATESGWFEVHHRKGKLGLGSAIAKAMSIAVDKNYKSLITLDADWSHPPDQLPAIVQASENADVVVGSRYCRGGAIEGWPLHRRIASRLVNAGTRFLLGTHLSDCSGNYRLYKTALLKTLLSKDLQSQGYAYLEEVLWHLQRLDARFAEVPITFTDRRSGQSKISIHEAWGVLCALLRMSWQRLTTFLKRSS